MSDPMSEREQAAWRMGARAKPALTITDNGDGTFFLAECGPYIGNMTPAFAVRYVENWIKARLPTPPAATEGGKDE